MGIRYAITARTPIPAPYTPSELRYLDSLASQHPNGYACADCRRWTGNHWVRVRATGKAYCGTCAIVKGLRA